MIIARINVDQIDKSRIFEGKKHKYLDLVILEHREVGEFGDTHFITQSATKEERQQRKTMPIIGSGREIKRVTEF